MSTAPAHPTHLDPSELGTKEYWDQYYQNDLDNGSDNEEGEGDDDDREGDDTTPAEPSELESWFDDVGAPEKTLAFLTSTTFPLSPNYHPGQSTTTTTTKDHPTTGYRDPRNPPPPTVLDLGTGNGSALFALRLQGRYPGRMVGVDYSTQSIELARKLWRQYSASSSSTFSSSSAAGGETITFHVLDLINDNPVQQKWWPRESQGFDLVLDKGTFDAISLSSATVVEAVAENETETEAEAETTHTNPQSGVGGAGQAQTRERRVCELYPAKVLGMVKPGGFLLVTSCNWTEEEVIAWFTGATSEGRIHDNHSESGRFEVYDTIKYPVFEFGGQKGQGVASVCFRKTV